MKLEYSITSYEVKLENGDLIKKYKIKYFGGNFDGLEEFYGVDLNNPQTNIRAGYTERLEFTSRIVRAAKESTPSPVIEKTVVIDNIEYKLVEKKLSWWQKIFKFIGMEIK